MVALVASLTPIGKLEEMVNIGTLAAFTLVSIAVPILRKSRPDLERSFKVPFSPVLPILAARRVVYLMLNLSPGDLAALRDLDGAGLRHLLHLQPAPQPPGRPRPGVRPCRCGQDDPELTRTRRTTPRCPSRAAGRSSYQPCGGRRQRALRALSTLVSESLASPNSSVVLGS